MGWKTADFIVVGIRGGPGMNPRTMCLGNSSILSVCHDIKMIENHLSMFLRAVLCCLHFTLIYPYCVKNMKSVFFALLPSTSLLLIFH